MARSPAYAFVTLLTSDSYLPGALTLVAALNDVHVNLSSPPHPPFQTVCIITPETVAVETRKAVMKAFDIVIGVDVIREDTAKGLDLLGRPDLHLVLTKLHIFRLTQFEKIIFLDADVLPVRPVSQLFALPFEFSAVPDVGWPDIFNSGFMVFQPGEDKFKAIMDLVRARGSWDGGDQGILNEWRGNDWNRLSFTYNTTPTAAYTYAPAYERFGSEIKAIHFIGTNKPWKSLAWRAPGSASAIAPSQSAESVTTFLVQPSYDYSALVDKWYSVYDAHYRPAVPSEAQKKEMKFFRVPKYLAAWDEEPKKTMSPGAGTPHGGTSGTGPTNRSGGATMGLDQLKSIGSGGWAAMAAKGHHQAGSASGAVASTALPDMGLGYVGPASEKGEAQYIPMPLDPRNQLKPIQEETILYAYPFELVPSEPPPPRPEAQQRFVEPSDWAPPATATSEPPPHLFRPAPSYPTSAPAHPQIHHHGQQSWQPPPQYPSLPSQPPQAPQLHHGHSQPHAGQQASPSAAWHHHHHHAHQAPPPVAPQIGHPHHPRSSGRQVQSQSLSTQPQLAQPQSVQPRSRLQQQPPLALPPPQAQGAHQHHQHPPPRHHAHPQHPRRHHHHRTPSYPEHQEEHRREAVPSSPGDYTPPAGAYYHPAPSERQDQYRHHAPQEYRQPEQHRQPFFRPSSPVVPFEPPLETWNPAREPPPNVLPPGAYNQPPPSFAKNVWDQPHHHPQRRASPPLPSHHPYQPSWAPDYSTSDHSPAPPHERSQDQYPEDFFQPPPPPSIPSQLVREGHYTAVMSANAEPDRTKVARVFPWESKPRPAPSRVFPKSDSLPSPIKVASETPVSPPRRLEKPLMELGGATAQSPTATVQSPGTGSISPKPKHVTRAFSHDWRSEQVTPTGEFGKSGYVNVWDHVPSITRYATKLVQPPSAGLLPQKDEGAKGERPEKTWGERIEESDAASHEADDEDDESDMEDRPGSGAHSPQRSFGRSGKRSPLIRTGSSGRGGSGSAKAEKSVATTYSSKGIGTLQYRSQSVQTVPKSTQTRGVQVNRPSYTRKYRSVSSSASPGERRVPLPDVGAKPSSLESRPIPKVRSGQNVAFAATPPVLPSRQASPPGTPQPDVISPRMSEAYAFIPSREQPHVGLAPSPTITAAAAEACTTPPSSRPSALSVGTSSNRNSAAFSSPTTNRDSTYTDTQTTPRSSVILSSVPFPLTKDPHVRTSSNETGVTGPSVTTPPSSIGPSSPVEDDPATRARRLPAGRQWDPRRNVDLFKSQSQDVLARFLKMGSWGSEDARPGVVQP